MPEISREQMMDIVEATVQAFTFATMEYLDSKDLIITNGDMLSVWANITAQVLSPVINDKDCQLMLDDFPKVIRAIDMAQAYVEGDGSMEQKEDEILKLMKKVHPEATVTLIRSSRG